jgi:DNA-binding transcriptional regulator YdaS (Cro superfamily)
MKDNSIFAEFMKGRGRKAKLSADLNVERSTVTRWVEKGVPPTRVLEVERLTGIPRTQIRSDLYPVEADQ